MAKFKGIPAIASSIPKPIRIVLEALKVNMESGFFASKDDLSKVSASSSGSSSYGGGVSGGGGGGETPGPIPIITPDLISASGSYESVILSWENTGYDYVAYYVILRAATNEVGDATPVGSTTSRVFSDPVGPAASFYYWIRIVNTVDAEGELPTNGVLGETFDDPSHILDLLEGAITETELAATLAARIALIDGSGDGSVNARIATASQAHTEAESALAQTDSLMQASIDGNTAAIAEESVTRAAQDQAIVGMVSTLSAQYAGLNASIQQEAVIRLAADEHFQAQYTVKIDANGKVIGFGLASGDPDEADSIFMIRADKFAFCQPTGDGGTEVYPFIIGNVNGVATVGVNGQLVVDGSIVARCIAAGAVTADKISVSNLAAISANMGNITAGTMNIGSGNFVVTSAGLVTMKGPALQSSNYAAGSAGWILQRTGYAEFSNVVIRGDSSIGGDVSISGKIFTEESSSIELETPIVTAWVNGATASGIGSAGGGSSGWNYFPTILTVSDRLTTNPNMVRQVMLSIQLKHNDLDAANTLMMLETREYPSGSWIQGAPFSCPQVTTSYQTFLSPVLAIPAAVTAQVRVAVYVTSSRYYYTGNTILQQRFSYKKLVIPWN